jgi:hypothetical protein
MKTEIQYPESPHEPPPAKTSAANQNPPEQTEIFIIMQGGVVHEIVNLPPNINVTVIDYDIEEVAQEQMSISPLEGELCVINKW